MEQKNKVVNKVVVEFPEWTGDFTLGMKKGQVKCSVRDDLMEEVTYSPGCIQIEEYESDPIALRFLSPSEQGGFAIVRFNLEEWNNFIEKALDFTNKLS